MAFGTNNFGVLDYIVVVVTIVASLSIGVFYALKKQTTEDLLVGGRSMGPLPIAASMMVTYFSAISILGYPAEIVYHGMEMYMMTITTFIFAPISAFLFVPLFFEMKLTSIFTYFELRFKSLLTRCLASLLFIMQSLFISAVILYAPSIAMESILGIPKWVSIVGIGISCTIYTSIGGLRAVVWTDVFQLIMILIGMTAIVVKGVITAGGFGAVFEIAGEHGRLNLFNFTFDPFMRHNVFNFIVGFGFTMICMIATHQPQVQRYSSLPSKEVAIKAIILSVPINMVASTLVLLTGLSIFATYAFCDPLRKKEIGYPDQIVPYFVIQQLAFIPGMLGLFIACIFSAVLSTLSSVLNSLSAVAWEDFCSKLSFFKNMRPSFQAHVSRALSGVFGLLMILFAFMAQNLGALLPMLFTAIGATTGPLAGIFLMGIFFPCINKHGAIGGMLTGICCMCFLTAKAFQNKQIHAPLPTSIEGCAEEFNVTSTFTHYANSNTTLHHDTEWPEKLYTLSYLLYPVFGAIITILVGTIVSGVTGGFCGMKNVNPKYLHPLLRRCKCGSQEVELQMKASLSRRQNEYDRTSKQSSPTTATTATSSYTYYPYNYESVPNGEYTNGNVPQSNGISEKHLL